VSNHLPWLGAQEEKKMEDAKGLDRAARVALVAPFPVADVQWRVGNRTKDKSKGTALAYIESRAVMRRLDEVFGGGGWSFEIRPIESGGALVGFVGRLTTIWPSGLVVVREDAGSASDIEPVKGAASDALKRAAVQVGVGRYLHSLPVQWFPLKGEGKYLDGTPTLPDWAIPKS
jgi:Uncharacterized protein conserved in bacteria